MFYKLYSSYLLFNNRSGGRINKGMFNINEGRKGKAVPQQHVKLHLSEENP